MVLTRIGASVGGRVNLDVEAKHMSNHITLE